MKKSHLFLAASFALAGAYLAYEETAGLGNAERPPRVEGGPIQQKRVLKGAPQQAPLGTSQTRRRAESAALPEKAHQSATAATVFQVDDGRELDDVGPWQFHEMERVERKGR